MALVSRELQVIRFDFQGKFKVAQGVFVGATHQRAFWQGGQLVEGGQHLGWCALKQASTAAAEQRVAAKQQGRSIGTDRGRAKIGNVPGGVARYVQYLKFQAQQ